MPTMSSWEYRPSTVTRTGCGKFASIFRALPAWQPRKPSHGPDQKDYGVVVRNLTDQTQTFLEIANDTPYPIRLAGLLEAPESAAVEDLGAICGSCPSQPPAHASL